MKSPFHLMIAFFTFAIVLSADMQIAKAKTIGILVGGSECPAHPDVFQEEIDHFRRLDSTKVLYGGCDQVGPQKFNGIGQAPEFNKANFGSLLTSVLDDIRRGKIKTGDQVLLVVDAHGAPLYPPSPTGVHSIGLKGAENGQMSLSDLAGFRDQLESLGVRLAIVDGSCYSGTSTRLATDKTCVITAANAEEPGWATFLSDLFANVKEGESLEATFLHSRASMDWFSSPKISSPEGRVVDDLMDPLVLPFSRASIGGDQGPDACVSSDSTALTGSLRLLRSAVLQAYRSSPDVMHALESVQKLRARLQPLNEAAMNQYQELNLPVPDHPDLKWQDLTMAKMDSRLNKDVPDSDSYDDTETMGQHRLKNRERMRIADELALKDERFKKFYENWDLLIDGEKRYLLPLMLKQGSDAGGDFKRIYEKTYESAASQAQHLRNPCRDFKM